MVSACVWYVWPSFWLGWRNGKLGALCSYLRTRMDSSKQAQGGRFRGLVLGGRTAETMPTCGLGSLKIEYQALKKGRE